MFAPNLQICAKFSCKNFTVLFAQYFDYYAIILTGRVFVDTVYNVRNLFYLAAYHGCCDM